MGFAAGCFCEWRGKVLLLLRAPHTSYGSTWCLPGGKLDPGESALEAAIRETYEETGIHLEPSQVTEAGEFGVFHLFHSHLSKDWPICLNPAEHTDYTWVSPNEAHTLPLIEGGLLILQKAQEGFSAL